MTKALSAGCDGQTGPWRVLVVEDNAANVVVARAYLSRLGHEVDVIMDGGAFRQGYAPGHYDLILMDIQLPHLDGYQLTRFVRQDLAEADVPIIGVSAGKVEVCAGRAHDAGMDAFFPKPITWNALIPEMARLGAARPSRDRTAA